MSDDIKKIIITSVLVVVFLGLAISVFFIDIDLKVVKFSSVKSLLSKHNEIVKAENDLKKKESEYNSAIDKVTSIQKSFASEKTKYDAISDETINIIKEATTEENYNIEYMWITLGNYATKNNLSIMMAEPGGTFEVTSTQKDGEVSSSSQTKNSTTSSDGTKTTSDATNTSTSTTTKSTNTTDVSATTEKTNNNTTQNKENAEQTDDKKNTTTNTQSLASTSASDSDTLFKIQVSGSYLDVSDFIFEVENDKSLRFKLDNISMDYVSGTTIKASFNVKNLIINK